MDLYFTVAIIAVSIFLFVKDYFSIDTTSILIMAMFIVTGVLSPEEGFSGFNHPATITLGCMFVVSAAVFKSGLIDSLSSKIVMLAKIHYMVALLLFCTISAVFSAFVNDAAVVAILIPLALSVCRQTGIAPSKLMIPISFSALFGGTCTLIGTSTNILVSSIAQKSGLEPFGMFEFSLPALCLMGIGLAFIFIFSPILLPKRKLKDENLLKQTESYITEVEILASNKDIGLNIDKSRLHREYNVQILGILRDKHWIKDFANSDKIESHDILRILISPNHLAELKSQTSYKVIGNANHKVEGNISQKVYEMMVPAGSLLAGSTILEMNLGHRSHFSVIAIKRREETMTDNLSFAIIKEGDMLLVHGSKSSVNKSIQDKLLIMLSEHSEKKVNFRKAIPALIIAVGVVTTAATGITTILMSGMIGCLLLVTTGIIKPKEAYEAIEWKVIFMMAGVLSMGTALEKTGGADIISSFVFEQLGGLDPRITLSAIFLVTFLSTNVLSSKATAALMAPIVISLAAAMDVSYKPFLVAVMFACSLTFMTPVSYPTNTMVYAPGNYKYNDFLKIGTPLNIIIWVAASFIISLFFPF
jgi:di/tricarboxylate transporter